MSSSILNKRPGWLKKKDDQAPKPEPTVQSPQIDALDMWSRASQYPSRHAVTGSPRERTRSTATPQGQHVANDSGGDGQQRAKRRRLDEEGRSPRSRKSSSRHSTTPASSPDPVKLEYPAPKIITSKLAMRAAEPESPIKIYQSVERDMIPPVQPEAIVLDDDDEYEPAECIATVETGHNPGAGDAEGVSNHKRAPFEDEAKEATQGAPQRISSKQDVADLDKSEASGDEPDFDKIVRRAQRRKDKEAAERLVEQADHDTPASAMAKNEASPPPKSPALPTTTLIDNDKEFSYVPKIPPSPQPVKLAPIVNIFVHSQIPDSVPIRVTMRTDQKLGEIRMAWCKRQGFDERMTASVFLQWGRCKIFDFTTCKSLGIDVDATGDPTWKIRGKNVSTEFVSMEAWTPQLLAQDEAEKRREGKKRQSISMSEEPLEKQKKRKKITGADGSISAGKNEDQLGVVMTAKGMANYQIRVRPTTTFRKMIAAFRKMMQVPPDKQVHLNFDGERLDEDSVVKDTDIADKDAIDVHIKDAP